MPDSREGDCVAECVGKDNKFSICTVNMLIMICALIPAPIGMYLVPYKKYADYDEDALNTEDVGGSAGGLPGVHARACMCMRGSVHTRTLM